MNNRKFYSCERNNYYYGKLLASRDFQIEQTYMNNKRRMGNRLLHGTGIVAGLKVVEADDTAIILQSGCAIDGGGREIVVPETEVVKLATIEGSGQLLTNIAYLSISYEEKQKDKVYAVMGNQYDEKDGSEEYSHIGEGFRLRLQDADKIPSVSLPKDRYLKEQVLFEDEDYRIVHQVPAWLTADCNFVVKVTIHKKSNTQDSLTLDYTLEVGGLSQKNIQLKAENISLQRYQIHTCTQPVAVNEEIRYLSDFDLKVTNLEVMKNKQKCPTLDVEPLTMTVSKKSLLSLIVENSYKTAMDADIEESYDDRIYLAKLYLIRFEGRLLLERVEEVPFQQYVYSASQLMLAQQLMEYYPLPEKTGTEVKMVQQDAGRQTDRIIEEKKKNFVTGVFDLSLGSVYEEGKVFYSEEIMHGLGEGPVYAWVGYEVLNKEGESIREEIILGNTSLFTVGEAKEEQMKFSCGIKILPDRGTFIVAVRPENKGYKTSLRIRWYACRTEDTDKDISRMKNRQGMIILSPDTITTTPKGTVQIQPQFVNMSKEACSYEVLDAAGGEIDHNGIYTAPTAEGVYEVRVSCISSPEIFAHAYIIVTASKQ